MHGEGLRRDGRRFEELENVLKSSAKRAGVEVEVKLHKQKLKVQTGESMFRV